MSAFSRGIGLALSQRVFCFVPRTVPIPAAGPTSSLLQRSTTSLSQAMRNSPIIQAARNLQTSARLCAKPKIHAAKPTKTVSVKSTPPPSPAPSQWKAGVSLATANQLAQAGQPIILYESPSHFWFHFFSLLSTTFSVTYALVYLNSYVLNGPQDLHWLVPWGYSLICMAMVGMGIYFFQGTLRIVRRITAVPRNLLPKEALQAEKGKQSSEKPSPVAIEITLSQISSLKRAKKLYAAPSDVWLAVRMQDLVKSQDAREKAAPPTIKPDPTRDTYLDRAADAITNMCKGAKRSFTKGEFVPMKINGDRYKLDVSPGGKVLRNGKQVDALIPCYPERFHDGRMTKFLNQ